MEAYVWKKCVCFCANWKSSTLELARIFRTTVLFLSAQFQYKMFVKSEPSPLSRFPAINSRFKKALVYFCLKSFFVITLVQNKQICSFDGCRRNAHTLDYFGRSEWNWFFRPFNIQRLQICTRRQLQVMPLLIFGAKRKWKPFKRDKSTSRNLVARSAASRPNILYPEIHEVDLWQVYCQTGIWDPATYISVSP